MSRIFLLEKVGRGGGGKGWEQNGQRGGAEKFMVCSGLLTVAAVSLGYENTGYLPVCIPTLCASQAQAENRET